jgi:hypothetical protein
MGKAREILAGLGDTDDFCISKGWYERFKVRLREEKVVHSMESIV